MAIQCALVLQLVRSTDIKNSSAKLFAIRSQLFCDIQMSGPARLSNRFCSLHYEACCETVSFHRWLPLIFRLEASRDSKRGVPLNRVFEKCKFTSQKPAKVEALSRSAEVYSSENAEKRESGFEFIEIDRLLLPDFAVSASACKSRKIR